MKVAAFQFLIGPPRGQQFCMQSVNNYCSKYNIDHFLSTECLVKGPHIMFEKYQLFHLLKNDYDRVLYLDADIMITPNAKNIFNEYSDLNCLYAYDESDKTEWMDRDKYIHNEKDNLEWPINKNGKKRYFNAGVMLFSKNIFNQCLSSFLLSDIPNWPEIWYFGEQTIVNYWITKNKIPFQSLDYSFNRMDLGNYDYEENRFQANFIHYAGPCKYGNGNKEETIHKDYIKLYNKHE